MFTDRREAGLFPLGPGERAAKRKPHRNRSRQEGWREPSPLGLRREDTGGRGQAPRVRPSSSQL